MKKARRIRRLRADPVGGPRHSVTRSSSSRHLGPLFTYPTQLSSDMQCTTPDIAHPVTLCHFW